MMTPRVNTASDVKSTVQSALLLLLAVGLAACSSGTDRRGAGNLYGTGFVPAAPGSRIAAVLTSGGAAGVSQYGVGYPGAATAQQKYPGAAESPDAFGARQTVPGQCNSSERGAAELLVLFENTSAFTRANGINANTYQGRSFVGSGILGRSAGYPIPLIGLSTQRGKQSQAAFMPSGGLLLVSLTNCDEVRAIPVYDNAGIGAPYPVTTGPNPTEIATAFTPYGSLAAIATNNGVTLLIEDAVDPATGASRARTFRNRKQIGRGKVTSLAFSPGGEWLFMGVSDVYPSSIRGAGASIRACSVGKLVGEPKTFDESYYGQGLGDGCIGGNSALAGSLAGPAGSFGMAPGIQQVPGDAPMKIAINNQIGVFLSGQLGPYRFGTPNVGGEIDSYRQGTLPTGYMESFSPFGRPRNATQNQFNDIGIHPSTDQIFVAEKDRFVTYSVDNAADYGVYKDEAFPGGNLVSLAVDPGTAGSQGADAQFVLLADTSFNRVWISRLDAYGSSPPNRSTDFAEVLSGAPFEVAIRQRTEPLRPVAPPPQTAQASGDKKE